MRHFYFPACLFLLASCSADSYPISTSAYTPTPGITMLKEEKELKATLMSTISNFIAPGGSFSLLTDNNPSGNTARGGSANIAYAFAKHWAVTSGYTWYNEENNSGSSNAETLRCKRTNFQIAVGYFTPLRKTKNLYFEVYGGITSGTNKNRIGSEWEDMHHFSRHISYFAQPGIFYSKKHIKVGFTLRESVLKFYNVKTDFDTEFLADKMVRLNELEKDYYVFLQPAVVFDFPVMPKWKIKGNAQLGSNMQVGGHQLNYSQLYVGLGIMANIGRQK